MGGAEEAAAGDEEWCEEGVVGTEVHALLLVAPPDDAQPRTPPPVLVLCPQHERASTFLAMRGSVVAAARSFLATDGFVAQVSRGAVAYLRIHVDHMLFTHPVMLCPHYVTRRSSRTRWGS